MIYYSFFLFWSHSNSSEHFFNIFHLIFHFFLHLFHVVLNLTNALLELFLDRFNDMILNIFKIIFFGLIKFFVGDNDNDFDVLGSEEQIFHEKILDIQFVSVSISIHLRVLHDVLISIADNRNQEVEHDDQDKVLVKNPNNPDHPELQSSKEPVEFFHV